MDEDPKRFARLIEPLRHVLGLEGETYKRHLACEHGPEPRSWYQRRNVYIVRTRPGGEDLIRAALSRSLASAFTAAGPLYVFLSSLSEKG